MRSGALPVDLTFTDRNLAVPLIDRGLIKALAITDTVRLPSLPNVPTMTELGIPNFVFRSFETLTVKAGTSISVFVARDLDFSRVGPAR